MKQVLPTFILMLALLLPALFATSQANAANVFPNCPDQTKVCQDASAQGGNKGNNNPIITILKAAINVISFIVGAAAVIGVVVSGLRFITSGGDSNAMASARSGLVYSLVGIAIVVLAQTIVALVLNKAQ